MSRVPNSQTKRNTRTERHYVPGGRHREQLPVKTIGVLNDRRRGPNPLRFVFSNPNPGTVINKPGGPDVYGGVVIDYRGEVSDYDGNQTVVLSRARALPTFTVWLTAGRERGEFPERDRR